MYDDLRKPIEQRLKDYGDHEPEYHIFMIALNLIKRLEAAEADNKRLTQQLIDQLHQRVERLEGQVSELIKKD